MLRSKGIVFFVLCFCLGLFSCSRSPVIISGGATFPFPLYERWFKMYEKKEGLIVDYQAIGSGSGQEKLFDELLDFAGSDVLMSDELHKKMLSEGRDIVQFPSSMGAVVILYNLETSTPLRLTSKTLSDIFLGKIFRWDDERLLRDNPEIKNELKGDISVVYRSDGSGETANFSTYLSKEEEEWAKTMGSGKSLNWRLERGIGAKGNAGVSGVVLSKKGSISYVSLNYALQTGLPLASLKNRAGNFIVPSVDTISHSLITSDFHFGQDPVLFNSPDAKAYPLSLVTYILVPKELSKKMKKEPALKMFRLFQWMMSDEAQNLAIEYDYAPLPQDLRRRIIKEIFPLIKYHNKPFL